MVPKLISSESIFGSHFAAERGMDAFSRKRKESVEEQLSMIELIIALVDDVHVHRAGKHAWHTRSA